MWVGATMVLSGELTLGQLIAFRIISGYVTQPLLRLSTIWQNIQELRVSFERLADVVDTPQESNNSDQAQIPLPPVIGGVKFEGISFEFVEGSKEILKNIDLNIKTETERPPNQIKQSFGDSEHQSLKLRKMRKN